MKINKIKQLSERDHMLLRPGQYIGATTLTKVPAFVFNEDTNKFEFSQISYVPALLKIISEIIDNALDEAVRTDFKYANKINIEISDTSVKVSDNGRGIPLAVDSDSGISQLELALAYPRAGTNFNDDERNSIGMNGIGSYATNVMSTKFKATSITGKEKGVLTCSNNLDKRKCTITSYISDKIGTTVEFEPDMSRFETEKIDDTHKNLVYQRILFLSISYPEITFKFNGKIIKFRNSKNFLTSFNENFAQVTNENYLIGIVPNSSDDFNSKSIVNGADCINGGNHIDYIHSELIGRIKTKLEKKYPNIKPGDIKNKLTYIVTIRDFKSPLFDSQTKEKFTSNISEIKEYFKEVDWDKLANQVVKSPELIDPIIETFKIREELKSRQALNKLNKGVTKNFKCEKFLPATKNQKWFFICEGNSASSGLSACLGRADIGYFASRGKPLNAYDASFSDLLKNEELSNIIKILNLDVTNKKEQNLTYENVVLASDSDLDGYAIAGLYIGFFMRYAPSIIKNGKLKKLRTPIMAFIDKNDQVKKFFFTFDEYNKFISTNTQPVGTRLHYFKGLGSWEPATLKPLITKYGLEYFLEDLQIDKLSENVIDDWLNGKKADKRKEYLRDHEFSIFSI